MATKAPAITSLTINRINKWAKTAKPRQQLGCEVLAGFHAVKKARHVELHYRYTGIDGKRKTVSLGWFPQTKPEPAARQVLKWKDAGADPVEEQAKEEAERQAKETQAVEAKQKADEARKARRGIVYLNTRYGDHMEAWAEGSSKQERSRLIRHFGNLLEKPMDEITRADIRDWQWDAVKGGLRYSTIRRNYAALRAMLEQAVKDDRIETNPLEGHQLDKPTRQEQERLASDEGKEARRPFTDDERARIFRGLDLFVDELRKQRQNSRSHGKRHLPDLDGMPFAGHWVVPLIHVLFHTGLRLGDAVGLEWGSEVNMPFRRLVKKPNKTTGRAIRNGRRPAVVEMPINDRLHAILTEWWEYQGKPQSGYVFPSAGADGHVHPKSVRKPWERIKALGDVPAALNLYAFRHNLISVLLAQGMPVFTVAKLAGQKSVEMIVNHYGHNMPEREREAVDIMAGLASVENTTHSPKTEAGSLHCQ